MRWQFCILSLAAPTIIGCDPASVVEGTVTDGAENPIAGAHVSVNCKKATRAFKGDVSSDSDGRFTLDLGIGCLPDDCHVVVSVDSESKEFNVGEHCETAVWQCDDACNLVQIDAQF